MRELSPPGVGEVGPRSEAYFGRRREESDSDCLQKQVRRAAALEDRLAARDFRIIGRRRPQPLRRLGLACGP